MWVEVQPGRRVDANAGRHRAGRSLLERQSADGRLDVRFFDGGNGLAHHLEGGLLHTDGLGRVGWVRQREPQSRDRVSPMRESSVWDETVWPQPAGASAAESP